jgi:ABC-type nitrate/sulfonate/bicarbonate transport system substrate-binding protein/DNA-binding ferritin-like protein
MNVASFGRFSVILLALWAFLPSSQGMGQEKLRVGLSSIGATNGSIWVAEEKGLFRKHGVDVEVIFIGGGGARVVSSLLAGDINFSVGGGEGSIRSQMRGAETVIASSTLTKGLQRILAKPEIKTYQDLKGRKVGITQFGSAAHLVLVLMLKKWNMRPDQVQILQVGSSPALLASLDKGGIDAAVLTLPTFFLAEDKGYRVVADPMTMDIYYLQNTLETTRSFLRKNREQALKFMRGYIEGIAYFKKNKKESLDIMRAKLRIQSSQERDVRYLEMSYNLMTAAYSDIPYPSLRAVQSIVDKIAEEVESYVDMIAERAVQLGGIAEGTVRVAASRSRLDEYPLAIADGSAHVEAVARALSTFGREARMTIDETDRLDDADTADMFTEISRGIDKWLWFVEAHTQASK